MPGAPAAAGGSMVHHHDFPSAFVQPRNVEVWLPPGYEAGGGERYPVLYMHDGQNVFSPATSYTGVAWGPDETLARLIAGGQVRAPIVVAVWNTAARGQEYMPQRALAETEIPEGRGAPAPDGPILSDAYLRFLVEELKPFIDREYRTLPGPADTLVMGSSMGALISAYALTEYPAVFGGAGCLSTHWPKAYGVMVPYLRRALPAPGAHRFWFDHGTETLDALYAPYQRQVDAILRAGGYTEGVDWVTRVYPGAEHSERAWRERLAEPLTFLLGR